MVLSDYYGVRCLHISNFVAKDTADATKQAIEGGVDMELPDIDHYYHSLVELVKKGKVSSYCR